MVNFVKTFKELINDLSAYVKDFHTTGLSWNAKALLQRISDGSAQCVGLLCVRQGGKATEFNSSSAAAPKPAAAPAAAPVEAPKPAAAAPSKPAGGNMFAELSKGGDITAGLKKVTRDMTNKDKKIDSLVSTRALVGITLAPCPHSLLHNVTGAEPLTPTCTIQLGLSRSLPLARFNWDWASRTEPVGLTTEPVGLTGAHALEGILRYSCCGPRCFAATPARCCRGRRQWLLRALHGQAVSTLRFCAV